MPADDVPLPHPELAAAPVPSVSRGTEPRRAVWGRGILRRPEFGLLVANVVVYLAVLLLDPLHNFGSGKSLQLLLTEASMLAIFAVGSTVVIIAGGIDLSVGSSIAFSGMVFSILLRQLAPEAIVLKSDVGWLVLTASIGGTLVSALGIGALHAGLITRLGLPPFIATLGTLIGLRSLGRVLAQQFYRTDKVPISAPDARGLFNSFLSLDLAGFELSIRWVPLLVAIAVALLTGIMLKRTVVGRHLYALGGNEPAARLSGIRTDRLKLLAYCLGSLLSGVAGILYASREGQGNSQTMGVGYELNAIAAAVVGGCSLRGGSGTIAGTVLGVAFLTLVINGIPHVVKIDSSLYEGIIVGVVVILAVAVNQIRARRLR